MDKSINNEQNTKRDFLERISRMYYVLEMNQKEIAEQLDIGRSSVARFLSEAKQEGVVRFYITSNIDNLRRSDLENELVTKYKLKDAVVVQKNGDNMYEMIVGNYLNSIIPYQGSLGLGLGRTVHKVGKYLHVCDARPDLKIVQMTGSIGRMENEIPSTSLIQNWAQALNAKPYFLPAPALVESKKVKEYFLKDKNIESSCNEIRNIDISIVSIGDVSPDATILRGNLDPELTSEMLKKHSVGDILLHFFDKQGNFSLNHISDRVLGTEPIDLLRIPTRIALAYGEEKADAIKGALNGRLVNILITTDETAKLLL
ncbi:sugar-binding transcriptional regulator [Oceanobacillus jeddahense]